MTTSAKELSFTQKDNFPMTLAKLLKTLLAKINTTREQSHKLKNNNARSAIITLHPV